MLEKYFENDFWGKKRNLNRAFNTITEKIFFLP